MKFPNSFLQMSKCYGCLFSFVQIIFLCPQFGCITIKRLHFGPEKAFFSFAKIKKGEGTLTCEFKKRKEQRP